jgi:hypothetical protein
MRHLHLVEHSVRDIDFDFRLLRRIPGLSFFVVLCLILGLGANTFFSAGLIEPWQDLLKLHSPGPIFLRWVKPL